MEPSSIEKNIYTNFGQRLLEALKREGISGWEKAVLKVGLTITETVKLQARYFKGGQEKSMSLISPKPYNEILELKKYTDANNYTPWNRFIFELTPDHQFNISYEWDQALDDEYRQNL